MITKNNISRDKKRFTRKDFCVGNAYRISVAMSYGLKNLIDDNCSRLRMAESAYIRQAIFAYNAIVKAVGYDYKKATILVDSLADSYPIV